MEPERIGIIGNGIMGVGIASICVFYGYDVILFAREEEKGAAALKHIKRNIKMLARKLGDNHPAGSITALCDLTKVSTVTIAIECVSEDFSIKQKLFRDIAPFLTEQTILATNTSSISISKLANTTDRPEKFIGLHFMNPATAISLTELIVGDQTSESTIKLATDLLDNLQRTSVLAADTPGFIVNRLLITMINEAANLVGDKIGSVEDIDICMKIGANHPLGPLALADLIGLDTCLAIMETIHSETKNDKYLPSPTLRAHCKAGYLGRKTKQGFHHY